MPTVNESKFSTIDFTQNNPPIDFNYFVIDTTDLSGVYSSYKGSFSIFMFADFLLTRYKTFYDKQMSIIDERDLTATETKNEKKSVKTNYPKPEILLEASSQTFLEKVLSLAKVSKVEHAVTEDTQSDYSAYNGFAKGVKRSITVDLKIAHSNANVKNFIKRLFNENSEIDFLAVSGRDGSQKTWTYNYKKNYKKYDKINFEDALDLIKNKYIYELSNDMIEKMKQIKRE